MTTWADFLSDLRSDLQDTSTSPRWSDKTLWVFTKDAIRDYSTWFPKRVDHDAMTLVNGVYPLPLDFLSDIYVEAPADTYLEKRQEIPGTKLRNSLIPGAYYPINFYYIAGGNLYLAFPCNEVYLTYQAARGVPASETDNDFVLEIPDADLELIRLYVKGSVYEQMRSRQASLDRFKLGTGPRDDNPLMPETTNLIEMYHTKIAERFPGGNITLFRSGRLK